MVAYEQIGMQNVRSISDGGAGACNIRSLLLVQTMDSQSALPLEKVNEDTDINFDNNIIDAKQMSRIMR